MICKNCGKKPKTHTLFDKGYYVKCDCEATQGLSICKTLEEAEKVFENRNK
jgi:hypothetical protein